MSIERFVNYQVLNNDWVLENVSLSGRGKSLFNSPLNVSILSVEIGLGLKLERAQLIKLGAAAVLHDIEMIKFSNIYRQSRRLSVAEYDKMINHSLSVGKILERFIDIYKTTITAAPQESSQIDKTGYLYGLNGEALKEILKAKELFETRMLKVFMERIGPYPVGSWVKLNSGEKARVIKRNLSSPLRPVVQIEHEVEDRNRREIKTLNLKEHPTIFIKRFLKEEEL